MYLASLLVDSRTYTIFALIAPIVFAFILYPDSFTLSWNEGRGGFLFVLIFIVFDLLSTPKFSTSTKRLYIMYILSLFTIFYFASLELFGFQEVIKSSAGAYNVVLPDSWTWMWDFIVLASFLASALFVLFGTRFLKVAPAAIIYLAGSAIILALDAFFPYDSLGPLQIIVPFYLEIDEAVINWVDKHIIDLGPGTPAAAEGNSLVLTGLNGPFALRVFWPSAGVHSLIIYSIVMLAFLLKMQIPVDRRVAYFVIGTVGTAAVNIVRIISLSFFPLLVTSDIQEWEGYHSIAGEVMFLPWLIIYLITIWNIEQKTKFYVTSDSNNPN
ncbi:MAG TPA: thaumarchaeosortase [Nitrososphaeraceae archaeon]|nr:thaumarchaeosortase [Nitrososphaeraceae archaeon]